jgi:hypothetical protein
MGLTVSAQGWSNAVAMGDIFWGNPPRKYQSAFALCWSRLGALRTPKEPFCSVGVGFEAIRHGYHQPSPSRTFP